MLPIVQRYLPSKYIKVEQILMQITEIIEWLQRLKSAKSCPAPLPTDENRSAEKYISSAEKYILSEEKYMSSAEKYMLSAKNLECSLQNLL